MATVSGYDAFISYSHQQDRTLGPSLQASLERFAKPWRKLRTSRVFIDKANLAASPELWGSVEEGLASSRWFILLASDDAARSFWVDREVRWWLEHRSRDRLLIVATSPGMKWEQAERDWSAAAPVPPALRGAFPAEPLWIDLSDLPSDVRASQIPADRVAAVAAPVRGVPKDALVGEYLREHRHTMRLAVSMVAVLVVLTVFAVLASVIAVGQRNLALQQGRTAQVGQLVAESRLVSKGDPRTSLLLALDAYHLKETPQTYAQLLGDVSQTRYAGILLGRRSAVASIAYQPGGHVLASGDEKGVVILWDTAAQNRIAAFNAAEPVSSLAFSPDGSTLAVGMTGGLIQLWSLVHLRHTVRLVTLNSLGGSDERQLAAASVAFSPHGKILAATDDWRTLTVWNSVNPAQPTRLSRISNVPGNPTGSGPGGLGPNTRDLRHAGIHEAVT